MLRRLLGIAITEGSDTVSTIVPQSPDAGRAGHTSTTSLFVIYMAIGFSVTFACILIIMTAYHWVRRSLPALTTGSRHASRRNSSHTRPQHEPKQLFVVQHPGGHANLAFRENEDLKPYKKKSCISVFSADLDEDSFTIPAVKNDATDEAESPMPHRMLALQLDSQNRQHMASDIHSMSGCADSGTLLQESHTHTAVTVPLPAMQRMVAHTASQTSPRQSTEAAQDH